MNKNIIYNIDDLKRQILGYIGINREKLINNDKNTTPLIKKPKACIVYLASPKNEVHSDNLFKKKGISKIDVLIESIKTSKAYLPKLPILIFHEDYSIKEKQKIIKKTNHKKIKFIKIDFKTYKNHKDVSLWLDKQEDKIEGRPAGYRMMCRFFSGHMQRHPALKKFDYYVRMDHDSFFIEPKTLNINKCVNEYNFDYLYRTIWFDHKEKKAIWEFTKKYAKKNNLPLEGFKKLKMLDNDGNFNGLSAYNNFHVFKLDFWRRKEVQDFIDAVENVDGHIKLHWHDTGIQSMIVGLFDARVLEKTDFGYRHNIHYSKLYSLKIKLISGGRPEDYP